MNVRVRNVRLQPGMGTSRGASPCPPAPLTPPVPTPPDERLQAGFESAFVGRADKISKVNPFEAIQGFTYAPG